MANTLQLINGVIQRIIANATSAGAADAGKLVQLDAGGKLDQSLLPSVALVGHEDYAFPATEAISAGDIINVYDNLGTPSIRKADATDNTKPPMGFALAAIALNATGTVRLSNGVITGLTGLTAGVRYYLSALTPGAITATPPATTGNVIYAIGRAKSATEFNYIDDTTPVILG